MGDTAEGTLNIEAGAAEIMEVIADFEAYPEWAGMKAARILERGGDDRPTRVAFELEAPVVGEVRYTLAYEYDGDDGVSWTTVEAQGKVRDIKGEYLLDELDEDETRVTYRLEVDLDVPIPSFLKKQGQKQAVKTALEGLKRRVESPR